MTTTDQRPAQTGIARQPSAPSPASAPKIGGDELFVAASHVLITDRQVSHPAFRLWCVLHRLWFLREPPTMELLQELMGTFVEDKTESASSNIHPKVWQLATRRSIERWLNELETAGWLVWARREETSRRYHLRTSARSATDTAVLNELRTLLNSGKATLTDVQALLNTMTSPVSDATGESHDPIAAPHADAGAAAGAVGGATSGSHQEARGLGDTTTESHHTTAGSRDPTPKSHHAIPPSHDTTAESHGATQGSQEVPAEAILVAQNWAPYNKILQKEIERDPPPPPAAPAPNDGGGGGPTESERYLIREGFSARSAHQFRDLDLTAVRADLERRHALGQGIGAIVTAWRLEPPEPLPALDRGEDEVAARAASAKAQALAIAPPDARPLEIQYLALDLDEGVPPEAALANLSARRAQETVGGVV